LTPEGRSNRLRRRFDEHSDALRDAILEIDNVDARFRELERFEYGRDYDRLLYSSAFRKLGGVTQVVSASRELGDFHNRMTHSLKVAQTGVRLVAALKKQDDDQQNKYIDTFGGLDAGTVRAACLAHDFGHPPFGHLGEYALRDVCNSPAEYIPSYRGNPLLDSFEGNAQTFKIVARLSFRESVPQSPAEEPALNLTYATLASISKYPWARNDPKADIKQGKKWGAYATEATLLEDALRALSTEYDMLSPRETVLYGRAHHETRTIEAQIMDLADDIAYAVHDIEDFFRAGLIPLNELTKHDEEFNDFTEAARANLAATSGLPLSFVSHTKTYGNDVSVEEIRRVLKKFKLGGKEGVFRSVPRRPYNGSIVHRREVHDFASGLIGRMTAGIHVDQHGVLYYEDPETHLVIEVLKQLTDYYVHRSPSLGSAQVGQRNIVIQLVKSLYEWLSREASATRDDASGHRNRMQLPARLRDYYDLNVSLNNGLDDHARADASGVLLRTVVDYIASLTDEQARAWHDRIVLGKMTSMIDRFLFI
jgi:dGTPase